MKYRADVDGLRAVAVIGVILFHAGLAPVGGGFTGVDVFFVISGYLIIGLIMAELDAGTFSFVRFWLRRARRILPALFLAMLVSVGVFFLVLPPVALKNFGQSVVAQVGFLSNVLFWLESGYFDLDALDKPLLHTWSLSVEEQFYLFVPVILFLIARLPRSVLPWMLALATAISFAASFVFTRLEASFAFFMLFTRAWELCIGGLLALVVPLNGRPAITPAGGFGRTTVLPNLVAFGGLGAIIASFVLFDKNTSFPGYLALVPTLGAAAVILANAHAETVVGRVLSSRLLVSVGLISYSLYLWHWVALALNKALHIDAPPVASTVVAVGLSVVVAYLSYRFIEQPIRQRRFLAGDRLFIAVCGGVAVLLVGSGLLMHSTDGAPERLADAEQEIYETAIKTNDRSRECYNLFRRRPASLVCEAEFKAEGVKPQILIWGDSHAEAMLPAFDAAAKEARVPFRFTALGGCPSVWNVYVGSGKGRERCKNYNDEVIRYVIDNHIRDVVIVNRYSVYVTPRQGVERHRPDVMISPEYGRQKVMPEEALASYRASFESMVEHLRVNGARVHVITQPPELGINAPDVYFRAAMIGRQAEFSRPAATVSSLRPDLVRFFRSAGANVVDLGDEYCPAGKCMAFRDNLPLFRDDDHIGPYGTLLIQPRLERFLQSIN